MRPETKNADHSAGAARRKRGFLARLRADARGNTLAITAAFMIPLAAAIGGGIDMSRAYLAKARLNQACDAAALAGRRAMTNEDVETAKPEALKFLNFNFPQGTMNTDAFVPKITRPDVGVIRVSAATNVPTTIMRVFGYQQIPISVECDATQNFNNIDIVLVLDTTGSMDDFIGSETKISSLRTAVMAFYNELSSAQAQLAAQGLQLRYGIVPYSSTVNVGGILPAGSVINNTGNYESRVANYTTPVYTGTNQAPTQTIQTYEINISSNNCIKYGNNQSFSGSTGLPSSISSGGPAPADTYTYTYSPKDWGGSPAISGGGNKACRRTQTSTRTTYTTRYRFTNWIYRQEPYDLTSYAAGTADTLALGNDGTVSNSGTYNAQQLAVAVGASGVTTTTSTWPGCIEERRTVPTITSTTPLYPIPANADDQNIGVMPTDANTRWTPMRTDIVYSRSGTGAATTTGTKPSGDSLACPSAASTLAVMTQAQMQAAVNGLTPQGYTYHDIGMLWGARLIAPTGIFGTNNPTVFNDRPVSRYIIFMTDGVQNAQDSSYSAYGLERLDQRVTGGYTSDSDHESRHAKRFQMACNSARTLQDASGQPAGAQIWAIQFDTGSTVDQTLVSCAGSTDRTALVTNGPALIAKFKEIAKNIGTLRLAK